MTVPRVECSTLPQFVEHVVDLYEEWDAASGRIWFRGTKNLSQELVPGYVWRNTNNDDPDEDSLIDEFFVAGAALSAELTSDPWAVYSLMQHHRLPTRLLDWSKSALIALYFSLEGEHADAEIAAKVERGIWVLDPYRLNEICVSNAVVFCPSRMSTRSGNVDCDDWLPRGLQPEAKHPRPRPDCPIAIEPPFSNRRLYAQQGCFTLHGTKPDSLTSWLLTDTAPRIRKFVVPESSREAMQEALYCLGIREDAIYQDYDSLSARIKREMY